jgi:hypothetical protein
MNRELESILEADDEARARIDAAAKQAAMRQEEAHRDAERRAAARKEAARRGLENEVQSILAQADREALERGMRRASHLAEKDACAESLLGRAADAYARIVAEGPAAEGPT